MQRLVAVLVAGVALFVLLAVAYPHDPLDRADRWVAGRVAAGMPGWAEWAARPLSVVGGWIGLVVAGSAAVGWLAWRREWLDAAFVAAAFAGGQLLANLLKPAFGRPRPELGGPVTPPDSAAFPSGHAAAATACVGALAVLACERLPSRRARAAVWCAAVGLGVGIAASRVVVGVHWVSDVLAGAALGVAWLALCLLARDAWRGRRAGPSATLA